MKQKKTKIFLILLGGLVVVSILGVFALSLQNTQSPMPDIEQNKVYTKEEIMEALNKQASPESQETMKSYSDTEMQEALNKQAEPQEERSNPTIQYTEEEVLEALNK